MAVWMQETHGSLLYLAFGTKDAHSQDKSNHGSTGKETKGPYTKDT